MRKKDLTTIFGNGIPRSNCGEDTLGKDMKELWGRAKLARRYTRPSISTDLKSLLLSHWAEWPDNRVNPLDWIKTDGRLVDSDRSDVLLDRLYAACALLDRPVLWSFWSVSRRTVHQNCWSHIRPNTPQTAPQKNSRPVPRIFWSVKRCTVLIDYWWQIRSKRPVPWTSHSVSRKPVIWVAKCLSH